MVFLSIALRYLAFCVPVFALYAMALRRSNLNPKFLSYGWTGANLVVVGYLIYWGWAVAGLTPVRSFLYGVGATFAVLIPMVVVLALVVGGGDKGKGKSEPDAVPDG